MTVRAIYENGVFRPTEPVDLPEQSEVQVVLPSDAENGAVAAGREQGRKEVMEILSRRFRSGHTDTAARHNEHQP